MHPNVLIFTFAVFLTHFIVISYIQQIKHTFIVSVSLFVGSTIVLEWLCATLFEQFVYNKLKNQCILNVFSTLEFYNLRKVIFNCVFNKANNCMYIATASLFLCSASGIWKWTYLFFCFFFLSCLSPNYTIINYIQQS